MDSTQKVLTDAVTVLNEQAQRDKQVAESQLNAMEYNYKQDCRRTAMQLASRNAKNEIATVIVADAQILYDWMIDIPKPEIGVSYSSHINSL